ncbi:transmembrane protein, putative [Medicago truncatula]|uniref:Transmembrane protein, putative n=1 Tax=Medicago truncatula TaxID=3880 RepID=A0A072TUL0_MEDTR|nr:transmembrane protein, putative [Medicago truncatula]
MVKRKDLNCCWHAFWLCPWLPVHIPFEIWQTKSGQHVSFLCSSLSTNCYALLHGVGYAVIFQKGPFIRRRISKMKAMVWYGYRKALDLSCPSLSLPQQDIGSGMRI